VPDPGFQVKGRRGRDPPERRAKLGDRAERVGRPVDEERRGADLREVPDPEFSGATRRVQRIREEEQGDGDGRMLGRQQGRLAAAVGVAAQLYAPPRDARQGVDGGPESRPVSGGARRRGRALRTRLTEGKIAAEHDEATAGQRVGQRDEEWALRGRARTVGQDEAVPGVGRRVEHPAHGEVLRRPLVKGDRTRRGGPRPHDHGPSGSAPATKKLGRAW
jgi:hypothetical protein